MAGVEDDAGLVAGGAGTRTRGTRGEAGIRRAKPPAASIRFAAAKLP